MNPPSNGVHEFPVDSERITSPTMVETRPMYWSVRREVWENRSVYLAPLIVAAFVLFGSFIATVTSSAKRTAAQSPGKQPARIVAPLSMAPAPIMLTSFIVGLFYSLDALYGERRDRSILFWKSLPVSDLTTVLSKASIPIVVLPLVAFVISVAVQVILLPVTIAVAVRHGVGGSVLWRALPEPAVMIYGLSVHALWFAPIYAWFLLVSAWAKRAPFLWAVLPVLVISALERMTFRTSYFISMLQYRVTGAMREGFTHQSKNHGGDIGLAELDPLRFLSAPGLWVGLIFAAACLGAAVRLRRNREPI